MADKQKYYYLKIKENFFDSEDMKLLESMDNGYLYSNILMKMYLLSLKNGGKLMYKDKIPYNSKMLSTILNHNVDVLDKAIAIFKELNLIEILDSGAIFMLDIQNYIGKSSDEADRKREYRNRIEETKKIENDNLLDICPDICRTNLLNIKDRDKDKDIDKDIDINNMIIIYNWEDYKKCECLTKENKICGRRSSYNINGKNYCNQHSKPLIGEKYKKKEYFKNEELNDLFLEYLDLRVKLKCKNTDRAITLLLNELNKYEDEIKIEMINNSIMNSWKSVYPLKNKKESKKRMTEEEVLKYLEEKENE